jgi:predicted permease
MDVFLVVLQSVLVLLGIGSIGFLIVRRGIIPENMLGFVSRLAIDIALPCLVFASITTNFTPEKFPDWWQLPLWWVLFAVISLVLSLVTALISVRATRGEFTINLFYQNGLFFPLIIISGIFGGDSPYLPQLYIFAMIHPIMFFSTYTFFFRRFKKEGEKAVQWNRIINPILISTILAVGVQLVGFSSYLPDFIHEILRTMGAMAMPLIMIILGGSLYLDFQQKGKFYTGEIIKFVIIKNFVFPLAVTGVLVLLGSYFTIPYAIALLFILQAAVPPVSATPILSERAGGSKTISTQFVFSSFVVSVISIPIVFRIFTNFFPLP